MLICNSINALFQDGIEQKKCFMRLYDICTYTQRRVQDFFRQSQILFLGAEIFLQFLCPP